MKGLPTIFALVLVALLVKGALWTREAIQVAVGYSAKQLCSAVFVAGLPESFVSETDILPRMATLGPARDYLELETDTDAGFAAATLLGVRARAVHFSDRGCVLHADGDGVPPLPPAAPAEPVVAVPAFLKQAVTAAFAEPQGGGRNTLALLISHRGELIAERYAAPINAGTRMQGWSMNKSLMATWVGMQAQRGLIDPDAPLQERLAQWPEAGDLDPTLTLLHLLQMESGLDFEEVYGPGGDATRMLYTAPAMWTVPATVGQAYPPGEHFAYSSGDTVLASYVWQASLAMPYPQWLQENFMDPAGIDSLVAEADASGVQVGSSYAYLTARDWLRAGQLWLDAWHGRSPLLRQSWLRDSVSPRSSDPRGRYGRGFWLNTGERVFPGLPESLFYAGGNAGQYVLVVPEWELIVVRLGLSETGADTGLGDFLRALSSLREQLP
jgi:CubicO group peptidase (beta-lactamase class C family)